MAQSAGNTIELNPTQPDVKRSFQNSIQGDKGIWTIVLLLSLISLAVVYSSSSSLAYRESTTAFFFLLKQSGFVLIGFAVLYVCHRIPLGWYRKLAVIGLIASIFLLIITPFIGVTLNNGTRWLKVLGFSFQPAEVAKIALMLYIAKVVESSELKTFKEFAIYLLLPISAVCLLILWGSVSAGIMLGGIAFIVLVVAGVSGPYLVKTVGIIAVVAVLVFAIAKWTHLFPRIETAVSRFTTYVHDDKGDHFQATQAKIAIASGGFFGYYGSFYSNSLKHVKMYAGNSSKNLILIKTNTKKSYIITPKEMKIFTNAMSEYFANSNP